MKPREPRRKVLVQARMRLGNSWSDVCMLNISSRGMLLQCASPPPRGDYVEIRRAAHIIVGRVVWRGECKFGIYTQDKLNVGAIVSPVQAADTHRNLPSTEQIQERRTGRRTATQIEGDAENSRRISSALQYAALAGASAVAAVFLGIAVLRNLAVPMSIITNHL